MNNKKVAQELLRVAKELMATEFPTERAMKEYLQKHPDADKSKHRVRSLPTPKSWSRYK